MVAGSEGSVRVSTATNRSPSRRTSFPREQVQTPPARTLSLLLIYETDAHSHPTQQRRTGYLGIESVSSALRCVTGEREKVRQAQTSRVDRAKHDWSLRSAEMIQAWQSIPVAIRGRRVPMSDHSAKVILKAPSVEEDL